MIAQLGSTLLYLHFFGVTLLLVFYWKNINNFSSNYKKVKLFNLIINSFVWIAMILLVFIFLIKDYRFITVYHNVDNSMSFFDTLMATWASRQGSMMLWAVVQSLITVFTINLFEDKEKTRSEKNIVTILLFFNVLIAMFSLSTRPGAFATQSLVNDGLGLTPSLLNFWQQIHPPVAFLSYSAFIVPYAISIVGLMKRKDEEISERSYWVMDFFMMVGWVLTTIFILAGSIWAYEVDWGGLWIWDPVQVSSYILWIMASIYFHLKPLVSKDAPVHLFTAGLGWVGVTFAAFVVRGGLIEGPHQYIGTAQLIVFSLLLLGTVLGLGVAYMKSATEVIPEWMFSLSKTKNKYSLLTVWILGAVTILNITGISLNIVYVQLSLPTRDLSQFYGMINGTALAILAILIVLGESETLGIKDKKFTPIFVISLVIAFVYFLLTVPIIRTFAFILLVIIATATLTQLGQIVITIVEKNNVRRLSIRLIHFIVLLTLLSYASTDPQSIEVVSTISTDQQTFVAKMDLNVMIEKIFNGSEATIFLSLYDSELNKLGSLTIKQGVYLGSPWLKGDWLIQPTQDIYVRLYEIDFRLFFFVPSSLEILFKIVPSINIFRINLLLVTIIGSFGIWRRMKNGLPTLSPQK